MRCPKYSRMSEHPAIAEMELDKLSPTRPQIAPVGVKEREDVLKKYNRAVRRFARLQEYWNDEQKFSDVVETGRYLKLVDTTSRADEAVEIELTRLRRGGI